MIHGFNDQTKEKVEMCSGVGQNPIVLFGGLMKINRYNHVLLDVILTGGETGSVDFDVSSIVADFEYRSDRSYINDRCTVMAQQVTSDLNYPDADVAIIPGIIVGNNLRLNLINRSNDTIDGVTANIIILEELPELPPE